MIKGDTNFSLTCLLLLTMGCASAPRFNTTSDLAPNDTKEVARLGVRGVNFGRLQVRDGRGYFEGEMEPFTGVAFAYWDNGRRRVEYNYKNGVAGSSVSWDDHGRKTGEDRYAESTNQKESIYWFDVGQITYVLRSRDGKQEGLQEGLYKNGQKEHEWHYVDGKKHGSWVGWWENGQKQYQGNYANDQRSGEWIWWHENGRLARRGTFVAGNCEGTWLEWRGNGMKSYQEEFKNGVRVGQFLTWDWKGKINSNVIYELRDKHEELIRQATEVKLFRYPAEPIILRNPEGINKLASALKLEPRRHRIPSGLFFGIAQFVTKDGRTLTLSGNSLQFNVNSDVGSAIYLPVSGFLELVTSYVNQANH